MKQIMKRAWELAKQGVVKFGGKVREYFAASLSIAWKEIKGMEVKLNEAVAFETGSEKQQKWANEIRERIVAATATQLLPNIEAMKNLRVNMAKNGRTEKAVAVYIEVYNSIMNETSAKAIIDKYAHIRSEANGLKIFPNALTATEEMQHAGHVLDTLLKIVKQ